MEWIIGPLRAVIEVFISLYIIAGHQASWFILCPMPDQYILYIASSFAIDQQNLLDVGYT